MKYQKISLNWDFLILFNPVRQFFLYCSINFEIVMSSFRIRPRFRQIINAGFTEIQDRMRKALEDQSNPYSAIFLPNQITLKILPQERHFWSPQLNITMEEKEEGTLIRGLYGPNPSIWAMFFFAYSALGIILLFAGMVVLSQISLGMEAPLWWVIPVCASLIIIIYLFAQTGQKIGAQEMFNLHHFYETTLGEKVEIK